MKLWATLSDGTRKQYLSETLGEGGEKTVHATVDGLSVVALFRNPADAADPDRHQRLHALLGKHNLTKGPDGIYWKQFLCWPEAIVNEPTLGVVSPRIPKEFFFPGPKDQFAAGKEKRCKWFSVPKTRKLLPKNQRGDLRTYLFIAINIARAVGRLHVRGLAHSDLSPNNVLIDPQTGKCIIIDIDSLVVKGIHPPKVIGTPGYIAPEVMAGKADPCIDTDLHALAVLLYELFLFRHPLKGPKVNHASDSSEDERLSMGERALFIEHSRDQSNRPKNVAITYDKMGHYIAEMFHRAFVEGLQPPNTGQRPTAIDWEKALVRTTDLLLPCSNRSCEAGWVIYNEKYPVICPHCRKAYSASIPILNLYSPRGIGNFVADDHKIVLWSNATGSRPINLWHMFSDVTPGHKTDKTAQAHCEFRKGQWFLVNKSTETMNVDGTPFPPETRIELKKDMKIRLSTAPNGRLAVVQLLGG